MVIMNPRIGPVMKAFQDFKRPPANYAHGWNMEDRQIQLLCRQVREDKDALSTDQINYLFLNSMQDEQSLKCFLPRLLLLTSLHAGNTGSKVNFCEYLPSFKAIVERLLHNDFCNWPERQKTSVFQFFEGICNELRGDQASILRGFLDTHHKG